MNQLTEMVVKYQQTQKGEDFLPIYNIMEPKIRHMAGKSVVLGMSTEDIYEEMIDGLLRAVKKFDVTKGFEFSTYAYQWIKWITNLRDKMKRDKHRVWMCTVPLNQRDTETGEDTGEEIELPNDHRHLDPHEALELEELAELVEQK